MKSSIARMNSGVPDAETWVAPAMVTTRKRGANRLNSVKLARYGSALPTRPKVET